MSRTNKILIAALGVQAALTALTWTAYKTEPASEAGARPLLDFSANEVIGLEVTGQPNKAGVTAEPVRLVKKGDLWVLANAEDYPADQEKVKKVVEALMGLKIRSPIATKATNHNALKVGDKEYGRKIQIQTKNGTKSLIVGGGSGSSVHVRFAGSPDVYLASGMSAWTVTATDRSYINTKYVDIDKEKVLSVALMNAKGQLTFSKEGDSWVLAELPKGGTLDQAEVTKFIDKVTKMPLNEPVGREIRPEYGLDSGARVVITHTEDDKPATTTFVVGAQQGDTDSHYYIKADDNEFVATTSKYNTKMIRENSALDFLKKVKEQ